MSLTWEPKPEPRVIAFNAYGLKCLAFSLFCWAACAAIVWEWLR